MLTRCSRPTPRRRPKRSSFGWVLLALALLSPCPETLAEAVLELTHDNDLFSGTRIEDDLYTATVGIAYERSGWRLRLNERLFTDRAAGLRFDESFLTVSRELLQSPRESPRRWSLLAEAGVVHRGRGLFGQGTQNFIHEIVNEPEVRLPYVAGSSVHPTIALELSRTLPLGQGAQLRPLIAAESAGFKEAARVAVEFRQELPRGWWLVGELGSRQSKTEFAPLAVWMDGNAPTYLLGAGYREWISLIWSENAFGTEDRHLHLRLRFRL